MEQQRKNVLEALFKAKQEFSAIKKDGKNPAFRSKYPTLNSILTAIEPALTKHNLIITQSSYVRDDFVEIQKTIENVVPEHLVNGAKKPLPKNTKTSYKLPVTILVTTISHIDSGESIQSELPLIQEDGDPQELGKISSYARRYAILAILSEVPSEKEDDDGSYYRSKKNRYDQTQHQTQQISSSQSNEFAELIKATNLEISRLGWNNLMGKQYIKKVYNKTTRNQLTMDELKDFLNKLKSLDQDTQDIDVSYEEVN